MSQESALSGSLGFLNLGDLLQLLGSNGSTGELRITSRYAGQPGVIFLSDGNPVDASAADLQRLEALNALFGWVDGTFEFVKTPVKQAKTIKKSRMQIILDALRLLDDGKIPILGPESASRPASALAGGRKVNLPFIKGPLVDYMYVVDEEEFHPGEKIVSQGNHGDWIWVVLDGEIEILKETDQGSMPILRLGDGTFIGSLSSFLVQGKTRSATAMAVESVQLGVLDSQRLSSEYTRISPALKEIMKSLDKRLRQATDRAADIHWGQDRSREMVQKLQPVMKPNESETRLFKIVEGEAFIVRQTEHGPTVLARLQESDFFGRLPFLDTGQEPHSAFVYATKNFKVSALDPDQLLKDFGELSPTFKNILETLATCISVTSRICCDYQKQEAGQRQRPADTHNTAKG